MCPEDVPDLRKVVAMARMKRAGQVAHEAGIGLARSFLPRVEHHLAVLAWKPQRLPRHVVDVAVLGTVVLRLWGHCFPPPFAGLGGQLAERAYRAQGQGTRLGVAARRSKRRGGLSTAPPIPYRRPSGCLRAPRCATTRVALQARAVAHHGEVAAFAAGFAFVALGLGFGALLGSAARPSARVSARANGSCPPRAARWARACARARP